MYPHRIRLRGPWECTPAHEATRRVTMPCRWAEAGLAGYHGLVHFVRKFGYPGRIDPGEHVWLTCDGCTGGREVRLNDHLLSRNLEECFAFDVTTFLGERNHLDVLIEGESESAGLWGEVALEICRDAYLADMELQHTGAGLQIAGKVVGSAPQPLELYTLLNGKHVAYRTIQPSTGGEPFVIDVPGEHLEPAEIHVELIHVSSVWYAIDLTLPT